jgi:hypothetical protein
MARDPAVVPMLAYEEGPVAMDWRGKRYRAEDLAGHRWMFMQSVRPNLVAPASQR